MEQRTLGSTELSLTTVGLGTWAIGGPWEWGWGRQDDRASIATIHRSLELGINWIDTAPCYGLGHSEEIVGQAIAGRRRDVIIATKCGLVWEEPASGSVFSRLTASSVRKEVEDSLRRLGTDMIDLYQIHWPNPDSEIEEAWVCMARLVEEGKIRYAGVSNFSVDQLERMQKIHPVASLQPPYSMLKRGIEGALLDYCREAEVGVIVYSPMQAGLLTGRFTRERLASLPADDWRKKDAAEYQEPAFSQNLEQADALAAIARAEGRTLAELAIAWTLRTSTVTAAIVGARRPDQIEGTAPASGWHLTESVLTAIDAVLGAAR